MNKIWWKQIHNVLGIASALFIVVLAVTGLLLNHPSRLERDEVHSLASDPRAPGKFLLAKKDGLYRSSDGGKTLEEVPMLYPPQNVAGIAFSPADSKEVYVLEKWGRLLVSKDGGAVWGSVPLPFDAQVDGIELKQVSPGGQNLAILTSHGWLSSVDGGKNWDLSSFHKESKPLHRLILTIHNGYFFGPSFVWVYDFAAAALIIVILSGFILWKIGRNIG